MPDQAVQVAGSPRNRAGPAIRRPEEIAAEYARTGVVPVWPRPAELAEGVAVAYRNRTAELLKDKPVEELLRVYTNYTIEQMQAFWRVAQRRLLGGRLCGIGLELGSGVGILSSVAAADEQVSAILGVECVDGVAAFLAPQVARRMLGDGRASKVVPIIGSFDDIRLPAGSIDFILEIESLHHSDDMTRTLREAARVLKPGGVLLAFDRVQPDRLSDEQVRQMLDRVYPVEFLRRYNYPEDVRLTRRQNGEHEYRLREWKAAIQGAGLRIARMRRFWTRRQWGEATGGHRVPRTWRGVREAALYLAQPLSLALRRRVGAPFATTAFLLRKGTGGRRAGRESSSGVS